MFTGHQDLPACNRSRRAAPAGMRRRQPWHQAQMSKLHAAIPTASALKEELDLFLDIVIFSKINGSLKAAVYVFS
jgi:hypothetical protein